eukprot:Sspe_Gene.35577::Locus_17231_Transcript_1_2_Confidence_0.667_Length_2546::g.35577::m.35577
MLRTLSPFGPAALHPNKKRILLEGSLLCTPHPLDACLRLAPVLLHGDLSLLLKPNCVVRLVPHFGAFDRIRAVCDGVVPQEGIHSVHRSWDVPVVDDPVPAYLELLIQVAEDIQRGLVHVSVEAEESQPSNARLRGGQRLPEPPFDKLNVLVKELVPAEVVGDLWQGHRDIVQVAPELGILGVLLFGKALEGVDHPDLAIQPVGLKETLRVDTAPPSPHPSLEEVAVHLLLEVGLAQEGVEGLHTHHPSHSQPEGGPVHPHLPQGRVERGALQGHPHPRFVAVCCKQHTGEGVAEGVEVPLRQVLLRREVGNIPHAVPRCVA